jgi:hypothetical protein
MTNKILAPLPEEGASFVLTDPSQLKNGEQVKGRVQVSGGKVLLSFEGYGEAEALDGEGSPVFVDFFDGKLKLYVAPDINDANYQSKPLWGAQESLRGKG